jgi:FKBP12-rapamycin complex-associated protein
MSLALVRLQCFTKAFICFIGHVLNEFVRNCALPYLEEDFPEVRKAAALTCCSVFRRDPICFQGSNNSIEVISDVIDKLLTVGIADPGSSSSVLGGFARLTDLSYKDATIRQAVLANLHEQFDKHLAQAENVRSLFIALNDEIFENRETAVGLIGRLALHNPAYVMPSLRKSLIQLLTELEYSTVT